MMMRQAPGSRYPIVCGTLILGLLMATAVMAKSPASAGLDQPEPLQLVAEAMQQRKRVEEIRAVGLHPIVESMAMNATHDTQECALALLSVDRKLRLLQGQSIDVTVLGKAGKWASDVCGVPYSPCVDAKIERKLVEGRNRSILKQADLRVSEFCAS